MQFHIRKSLINFSIILSLMVMGTQQDCFAQHKFRISEDPIGSGGSANQQQQDSGIDNTFIYAIGGAIIVGIVAYALLTKNDDKKKETDTTVVADYSSAFSFHKKSSDTAYNVPEAEQLPVNIFFGVHNDKAFLRSKTYQLGVSVRL